MTTTKTPAAELEQAQQEVEEVLEQIKAGDPKVKPEDLEDAERRVRFARARVEGEERRREEEAERQRLQRLAKLEEKAVVELDPAPLRKARAEAEKALSEYIAACVAYNARLDEIVSELPALEPLPEEWTVEEGSSGTSLTVGERRAKRIRPMVEVSQIAHEELREHIPRGYIDLEQPY